MDFDTYVAKRNACLWNVFANELGFINEMIYKYLNGSVQSRIVEQRWNDWKNQDIDLIELGLHDLAYIGHA